MSRLANALEGSQGNQGWTGVPYVHIDGDTDSRDRQTACLQFREDPTIRVALLSITAAGTLLRAQASLFEKQCCSRSPCNSSMLGLETHQSCLFFTSTLSIFPNCWPALGCTSHHCLASHSSDVSDYVLSYRAQ